MVIKSLDVYFGQSYSSVEHQSKFTSDKVTVRSNTNTLSSDKLLTSIPLGSDRMSDGLLATSDNFTNGSDNVHDRPIF